MENCEKASRERTAVDITANLAEAADFFVENASERFSGLDFSVKSLEVLEEMLDEASDFYVEMEAEARKNIVKLTGAYLFEVARRLHGGKYYWYKPLNQPVLVTGLPDFEVALLALEKVKKRLKNGPEDSIPFYFAGYLEMVKQQKSGILV